MTKQRLLGQLVKYIKFGVSFILKKKKKIIGDFFYQF
jgi:hypothetical protein